MELNSDINSSNTFDFKGFIKTYTKNWKWFFITLVSFLALAFVFIRYSQPQYAAEARVQILEESGSNPELSAFQDLGILSDNSMSSGIEDEILAFKSRSNLIEVVNELNLNIKIEALGKILSSELYQSAPFKINFIASDSIIRNSSFQFYIDFYSETSFNYATEEDGPSKIYFFGTNIPSPVGDIVITPDDLKSLKSSIGRRFKISIAPVIAVAQSYQDRISISPLGKSTTILNLYLTDPIPQKAKDVINTLIRVFNKNAVLDKKAIADKTSNFIDDRITEIYSELSEVDQSAQDFKTGRGITDIASEASMNLNLGAANRQELSAVTTELQIAQSMRDIVEDTEGYETLPSNIGLSDATIGSTTGRYNELVLERNRLLKSANEQNPTIINLNQQLDALKGNLKNSINSVTNNLSMQANSLSGQLSRINSKIYSSPKNERALTDISREQNTIEALYLYLLEKREESQIAYASSAPKLKVVDEAFAQSTAPVSPNKLSIYFAALFFGLIIPFGIIYVNDLLDSKVSNKSQLEKITKDIPVLAELPKITRKNQKILVKDDRSVLAESLRILRTNLDYLINTKKNSTNKSNVIYVTSSVSGEGKTFIASNLAMVLANTGKKVVLLGADIRNPKIYSFFNESQKDVDALGTSGTQRSDNFGLTDYLFDKTLEPKDIVKSLLVHTNEIDVIYSGKTPPNPAELLLSPRFKDLVADISATYDYVIVDTAPLMVVSDTLIISKYSDHIIYVTRAGVTETNVINFPIKLQQEGKLNNLSFVVNDVKETNLGYGGKYGYGYNESVKKWWKFGA